MKLELSVLRCPPDVTPEFRSLTGGEFTVGRGPGVDWVLPDSARTLSKRHFTIAFRSGKWQLTDSSTNGTFMNTNPEPLGADVHTLRDGDRVCVGAYEIEVRLEQDAFQAGAPRAGTRPSTRADDDYEDRFAGMDDPLAPPRPPPRPFGGDVHAEEDVAPILHEEDDRRSGAMYDRSSYDPFREPVVSDHSPHMQDAFQPPPAVGQVPFHTQGVIPGNNLIPDDWDDILDGINPPPATPSPAEPVRPSTAKPASDSPFLEEADFLAPPAPKTAPPPPIEELDLIEVPKPKPMPTEPTAVRPPAEPQPAVTPVSAATDPGLLAAFMEGASVSGMPREGAEVKMRQLGAAFRAGVHGLRSVIMARNAIRSEFRIEQTQISRRGNNPLKFSADDDDALAALLGTGRQTQMSPAEVVADALHDIELHELASLDAMQAAVRALLEGLDPAKLRASAEQAGGLIPAQRKARAWDAFEALHAKTLQALNDDFDSVFGKAFARAYERAMDDLSMKEKK